MKKLFKAVTIVFAAALISQSLVWLASMAADSVPEAKASAKDEQIAVKEDRDEGIGFEKVSYWDTPLYQGTWKITKFIPLKNIPFRFLIGTVYNRSYYGTAPLQGKIFTVKDGYVEQGIGRIRTFTRFLGRTFCCVHPIAKISKEIGWYAPSDIFFSGNAMNYAFHYLPVTVPGGDYAPIIPDNAEVFKAFYFRDANSMYIDDGMAMYLAERVIE